MCAGMLDPQVGGDGFDYLQDFGARLPSMVISSLLGVPDEDQETFRHTIDRLFHIEPDIGMVNEISMTAGIELGHYLAGQLEQRLTSPARRPAHRARRSRDHGRRRHHEAADPVREHGVRGPAPRPPGRRPSPDCSAGRQ